MKKGADTFPYEDRGTKYVGQSFGKGLLPFIGLVELISATLTGVVGLGVRQMYEDFNYVMQDGSWSRLESQSRNEGVKDLEHSRQYEVNVNSTYDVAVTTYVVYTGNVRNPIISFTEGVNTHRIIPILMGERDGNQIIVGMQEKFNEGVLLTRQNLLSLALTSLISGIGSIEERIKTTPTLPKEGEKNANEKLSIENIKKSESIVCVFADEFSNPMELGNVEKVSKTSLLGQMIFEDGMEAGIVKIATTMLKKNKTAEETHKSTGIPMKQIVKIKKLLES